MVRQADRLAKQANFQEAIQLQDTIVTELEAARSHSKDNKVTESLDLQIQHHIKQKLVLAQRRSKYTKDLRNLQIRMAKASVQDAGLQVCSHHPRPANLSFQDSIYRTFQETESLLQHLKEAPSDPSTGAKMPKDDKIIIEELSTANNHLRGMVEAMFAELETYKKENSELRARVSDLEAERGVLERQAMPVRREVEELLGRQGQDLLHDSGHLPPLAPLELPEFDYGPSSSDQS